METRRTSHPSAEMLQAFGLGKLDDNSSGVLLNHLDSCADCRKIVASQSGDDFLNRLRQAHSPSATPAPPKSLGGMEAKPKPPPGPTTLFNLPPELADNPQYDILKELGRGGMGVVYLAKNKLMDRLEVLKVINKALLDRPGAVERFLREIRAAAKLSHVNVVAAYSALQLGELLVFAMEYVEGQDLAAVVKASGPLPVPHACFYVQQAAQGLQHAFAKKMVHRDIKPQNLILAREDRKHLVKILDFGLAKVLQEKSDDTGLTGEGKMLGTPDYMAPEQTLDATSADIRADIYSLGCTLYFLLSGQRPFKGKNLYEIMQAHQSMEAPGLSAARPEVPAELAAVVRKMMAKDRGQRYQTPLEVVQALGPFLKQSASPKSSPVPSVGTAKTVGVPPPLPAALAQPPVAWDSLTDSVLAATQSPKPGAARGARKQWLTGSAIAACLLVLGLLSYWLAVVLFRVETPNGTLIVEMNDEDVEARIKNGKLILSGPDGKVRYTLTAKDRNNKLEAGPYKIRVEGADGLVLDTSEFTLKKGSEVKVRVTLKATEVAKKDPPNLDPDRKAAEYVLSIGGIVRLNGGEGVIHIIANLPKESFRLTWAATPLNKQLSDEGLACFKDCKNLTSLKLGGVSQLSDAGLIHFEGCKNLVELDLPGCTGITDDGLAHFKDCKNLYALILNGTWVSDQGMAYFKNRKNLGYLHLSDTQVTDAGLACFQDCRNLVELRLSGITATDKGLAHFKNCKNLRDLRLGGTKLSDKGLAHFKDCKNLTDLHLDNTQMTGSGLLHFKDCKKLTFLNLGNTQVSDKSLDVVMDCPILRNLWLTRTQAGDKSLACFRNCKNLQYIELSDTQVSDSSIAQLKTYTKLLFLYVAGTKVTAAGIEQLKKALPKCEIR